MIRYTRKVFSVCLRHHPYPAAEGGSAQWSPPQPPTYMNEEELRRIANELLGVAHARWRGNARWPAPGILMNETHRRKVRVFHGHRASGLDTQITPPSRVRLPGPIHQRHGEEARQTPSASRGSDGGPHSLTACLCGGKLSVGSGFSLRRGRFSGFKRLFRVAFLRSES